MLFFFLPWEIMHEKCEVFADFCLQVFADLFRTCQCHEIKAALEKNS
jgi:hypothetical protein